ncbi:MAG: rod-binding protein [Rhodospirillaceae bacterium]
MDNLTAGYPNPVDSLQQTAKAPRFSKDMSPEAVRSQAEDFEAFFLSQFLNSMFQGIETDGPFGGGNGESVFREQQFQEYAKIIARSGGIGIADSIVRQMLTAQEVDGGTA